MKQSSQDTVKRLSLVRHIYRIGVEQSKHGEPESYAAVLTFHDAAEMLFVISCQHLDVRIPNNTSFMQYPSLLEETVGKPLEHTNGLNRLNKTRVSFKHHGILPNQQDVEALRANTTLFLEQAVEDIFGLDFNELSLINLIPYKRVRDEVKDAEKALAVGEYQDALFSAAKGFEYLVQDYEAHYKDSFGRTRFVPQESFSFSTSSDVGGLGMNFDRAWDKLIKTVDGLQKTVRNLALGINYEKFVVFDRLTPHLTIMLGGNINGSFDARKPKPSADDVRFCIDFVIDSALQLGTPDASPEPRFQGPKVIRTIKKT